MLSYRIEIFHLLSGWKLLPILFNLRSNIYKYLCLNINFFFKDSDLAY